jgi:hypothetical protein
VSDVLTRALGHGVTTMRGQAALAGLAWLSGAVIAAAASLPVWLWLRPTAVRPDADGLLHRLDPGTLVDLIATNGPAAFTGVILWTLLSLAIAAIAGVVLNAGLVAVVVTPDGRPMLARFGAGVRAYFLRFLRLTIVAAITGALLFVLLLLAAALVGRTFLYGAQYTLAVMALVVSGGAFLLTAAIVFTAMDYARIQLAVLDSRQAVKAWRASLGFLFRHPLSTMTLTIAFAAMAAVPLLVYIAIATPATSLAGIAMLFVVRQATVFVRVAARIGLLGAEHELWRRLTPPPPPAPEAAPMLPPEPPSAPPPDALEVPI